ncbi:hypothetical protein Tco_0618892 [Tanacetum coccineum]
MYIVLSVLKVDIGLSLGRDTIQLENDVSTISQEYLLEFTSEYGIPEGLNPELPGLEDTIVDFPEGYYQIHISQLSVIGAAKVSHFEIACRVLNIAPTLALFRVFYVPSYNSVFPTVVDWRVSAPKDEMPTVDSYLAANVTMLNTRRTPIQKQPEALLCLVGLSRNYLLGDDEYPTFLYDDGREMDLFNLISAPNPSKVKTGIRPRAAHEVPLLTVTANRVIEMKDPSVASGSSGTPSTVERSPLDFDNENPAPAVTEGTVAEGGTQDGLAHEEPPEETAATTEVAEEAVLGEEMASVEPLVSKRRKQLRRKRGNEEVEVNAPPKVLRRDHASGPTQSTTGGKSLASMGLEAGIPIPTPTPQEIPADVSDPDPLSYSKPQSVPEQDIAQERLSQGIQSLRSLFPLPLLLGRQVRAMEKIAKREQRIQAREEEIKRLDAEVKSLKAVETEVHGLRNQAQNLKTLLEAEVDMKKATEARNADLAKEVESLRAKFADLQVNNSQLSQQVSTLQAQVTSEEKIKASFKEFKRLEDEKVEQRCAEMDARLDALSIDFDKELYPHMLTAIAGSRWVIGHGLRMAVMKCTESTDLRQSFADVVSAGIVKGMSEGLKYGVEHGRAKLDLAALKGYDPKAEGKYIAALTALRDMNDTGEDAPPFIRDLRPSSSQLKIPVSDGVPVSVPTVIPQGLQILLEDAATQTELSEDEASPKLIRSKYLPSMYNLNWP